MKLRWAPVLAALVLAVALYLFAAVLTRVHLDQSGARDYSQRAAGNTPWQWQFTRPEDLVAARVFGAGSLRRGNHALVLTSQDASTVEVGFPLSRPADLVQANQLQLDYSASATPKLALRVASALKGTGCMARLPARAKHQWKLNTLRWRTLSGHACPSPHSASLLRLRIGQQAGQTFTLRAARLRPERDISLAAKAVSVPPGMHAANAWLEHLQTRASAQDWPLLQLPSLVGPQQQLALRDRIHDRVPGAVVLGPDATTHAFSPVPQIAHWLVAVLYALFLVGFEFARWRAGPGRRDRPLLELALALFGLAWLIPGLQLGLHPASADLLIAALGGAYALRLAWLSVPGAWFGFGHGRDYLAPFALLLVLAVLLLGFGHAPHAPSARQTLVYLIWALLQQGLMLVVVLRRLEQVFTRVAPALLGCAVIFALLHTPNARLMLLCLMAELWWAWCFMRSRALVPIALAHALFALVIQASLSGGWLRSLEVSARYFIAW